MASTLQSTLFSTAEERSGRWSGRNADKDHLRREIWANLERSGLAVGPVWSRIPNWVGADEAARRLSELPAWTDARVVKCNPDPPQIPVRLRALYDGKRLYMPVPEFSTGGLPWLLLDPHRLEAAGIQFELAATSAGAVLVGQPVAFEDVDPIDLAVCGSVAVTREGGRIGKGGGFADLELGLLRDLGLVAAGTPVVTTVHSTMVVDDSRLPIAEHDALLTWVVTEREAIKTRVVQSQAGGVLWDRVLPDQMAALPFLADLKQKILARQAGG